MGAGQAEWGMNIITDALHDRRSLEELISRTLLRLRREGGAARSNDFVHQIISYTSVHYTRRVAFLTISGGQSRV